MNNINLQKLRGAIDEITNLTRANDATAVTEYYKIAVGEIDALAKSLEGGGWKWVVESPDESKCDKLAQIKIVMESAWDLQTKWLYVCTDGHDLNEGITKIKEGAFCAIASILGGEKL